MAPQPAPRYGRRPLATSTQLSNTADHGRNSLKQSDSIPASLDSVKFADEPGPPTNQMRKLPVNGGAFARNSNFRRSLGGFALPDPEDKSPTDFVPSSLPSPPANWRHTELAFSHSLSPHRREKSSFFSPEEKLQRREVKLRPKSVILAEKRGTASPPPVHTDDDQTLRLRLAEQVILKDYKDPTTNSTLGLEVVSVSPSASQVLRQKFSPGDKILAINDTLLEGLSFHICMSRFKSAFLTDEVKVVLLSSNSNKNGETVQRTSSVLSPVSSSTLSPQPSPSSVVPSPSARSHPPSTASSPPIPNFSLIPPKLPPRIPTMSTSSSSHVARKHSSTTGDPLETVTSTSCPPPGDNISPVSTNTVFTDGGEAIAPSSPISAKPQEGTKVTKPSNLHNVRAIGRRMEVALCKSSTGGFGFTLTTRDVDTSGSGRKPIYIKNILAKGAAIDDGRLQVGDRVLQMILNSGQIVECDESGYDNIIQILRQQQSGQKVIFIISRQVLSDEREEDGSANENSVTSREIPMSPGAAVEVVAPSSSRPPSSMLSDTTDHSRMQLPTSTANSVTSSSDAASRRCYSRCIPIELLLKPSDKGTLGIRTEWQTSPMNGRQGLYIIDVRLNSPAHREGTIKIGDRLLQVNDVNIGHASDKETAARQLESVLAPLKLHQYDPASVEPVVPVQLLVQRLSREPPSSSVSSVVAPPASQSLFRGSTPSTPTASSEDTTRRPSDSEESDLFPPLRSSNFSRDALGRKSMSEKRSAMEDPSQFNFFKNLKGSREQQRLSGAPIDSLDPGRGYMTMPTASRLKKMQQQQQHQQSLAGTQTGPIRPVVGDHNILAKKQEDASESASVTSSSQPQRTSMYQKKRSQTNKSSPLVRPQSMFVTPPSDSEPENANVEEDVRPPLPPRRNPPPTDPNSMALLNRGGVRNNSFRVATHKSPTGTQNGKTEEEQEKKMNGKSPEKVIPQQRHSERRNSDSVMLDSVSPSTESQRPHASKSTKSSKLSNIFGGLFRRSAGRQSRENLVTSPSSNTKTDTTSGSGASTTNGLLVTSSKFGKSEEVPPVPAHGFPEPIRSASVPREARQKMQLPMPPNANIVPTVGVRTARAEPPGDPQSHPPMGTAAAGSVLRMSADATFPRASSSGLSSNANPTATRSHRIPSSTTVSLGSGVKVPPSVSLSSGTVQVKARALPVPQSPSSASFSTASNILYDTPMKHERRMTSPLSENSAALATASGLVMGGSLARYQRFSSTTTTSVPPSPPVSLSSSNASARISRPSPVTVNQNHSLHHIQPPQFPAPSLTATDPTALLGSLQRTKL